MGNVMSEGVCNKPMRFDNYNEAERCRVAREKETGIPHRTVETGWCYEEGVVCSSWWTPVKFKDCYDGAIFDDLTEHMNHTKAIDCAISLNHIEGGHSYRAELAQRNLIFQDSYRVTRTEAPPESSTLVKLVSLFSYLLSNHL